MIQPAKRLDTVQEYYFSKKLREVRRINAKKKQLLKESLVKPKVKRKFLMSIYQMYLYQLFWQYPH